MDILLKMTIMVLMPMGWAIILYPAAKAFKISWIFLAAASGALSILSLAAKRLIDSINPLSTETTLYTISIFFGVAALSFFFNTKNSWLNKKEEASSASLHPARRHVHLRHVLAAALMLEEASIRFYENLGDKAENISLKDLCGKLADEERGHKKNIESKISRWLPIRSGLTLPDEIFQELNRTTGMFTSPPPASAAVEALIRYAIDQEEKAARFYISLESAFPDAWRRTNLEMLAIEERSHAARLEKFLPKAA